MGRRFKGHVPPEMLEDQGVPGKLYFDRPQVIDIVVTRESGSNKVITMDANSQVSPVRLASSRQFRDFNRKEPVEYMMGLRPSIEEIRTYMKWAEIQGFALGSVVARRWCGKWRWTIANEWGVILGCKNYIPTFEESYAPFGVRWFNKPATGPDEGCWAEDLYLVHQCLSDTLLESIIEDQQQVEVT